MKWILKLLLLFLILQSFQCSDTDDTKNAITSEQLQAKKLEITNYINSFSCSETAGCNFIAFGSKPCGGPRTYLLFSNSVDLAKLQEMVKTYNEMDKAYNIKTGAVSDCMFLLPPTEVKCINGVCSITK